MVNNYRREMVMVRKPGYRMRGAGTWIAPRAGSYYRTVDDDLYYRGAGFRDWIKQAASTAFQALVKFIVPHIKRSGPDVAQMMTKYAANKAADYIRRTEKLGPAEGLIAQALSDLPSVVKDIVRKQIDEKVEPLTEAALNALRSRGGASPENREVMAQQAILDALPYIEEELEPLREKLSLMQMFGEQFANGRTREANATMQQLSSVVADENYNGALTPIAQLVESMITAVVQFLTKTNGLPKGMERLTDSCCRMCSQNSTLPPTIIQKLKEHHELGMNMGPKVSHFAAILPGLGSFEIDPEDKRGGFAGITALLAGVLPALVSGGMSLIGNAISRGSSDRGGAFDVEKELFDVYDDILSKHIAKHTNHEQAAVKRQLKAIAGTKQPAKRQKIK